MIEWFFNLSDLLSHAADTSFIIACDLNNKGSKKFASFKSIHSFNTFYKNEKIKNYYEVICTNNKSKLYIDLDIHNVTLFDSQNIKVYPGLGLRFIHKKIFNAIFRIDYGIGISQGGTQGLVLGIGQYF